MRFKLARIGAGVFALGALGIRIAEYLYTLDGEGYYTTAPLATTLNWALTAVLAAAVAFLLLCGVGLFHRQAEGSAVCGSTAFARIVLALMGAAVAVKGVLLLMGASSTINTVTAVAALAAAIGFLGMANSPKHTDVLAILPAIWLCLQTVHYFWDTYKYVHISANILGMLGWCAALIFVYSFVKMLTGAVCSKGRMLWSAGIALVFLPCAFFAPLLVGVTLTKAVDAAIALVLMVLAAYLLGRLHLDPPEEPAPLQEPDLSVLDAFLETVPDPEEEQPQENKE